MNGPLKPDIEWLTQMRVNKCVDCAFLQGERTPQVFGEYGRDKSAIKLILIGEAPGENEAAEGRPFIGAAGGVLRAILAKINLPSSHCLITNVVKCRPEDNRTPTAKEMKACLPLLEWELQQFPGVPIVTLGKVATHAVLGGNTAISKLQGGRFKVGDRDVYPTFHPAYGLRKPSAIKHIADDISSAYSRDRGTAPMPATKPVKSLQALHRLNSSASGGGPFLVLDIETEGGMGDKKDLSPFRPGCQVTMLGLKWARDQYTLHFTNKKDIDEACNWLNDNAEGLDVCGHNLKFDLLWLLEHSTLTEQAVAAFRVWDTMVVYNMIDEEAPTLALKSLCPRIFNVPDWSAKMEEDLVWYNSMDLAMTESLAYWEMNQTAEKKIPWVLSSPGTAVLTLMEYQGVAINTDTLEELRAHYGAEMVRLGASLLDKGLVNPNSTQQVGAALLMGGFGLPVVKRTPKGQPSLDKEALSIYHETASTPSTAKLFIKEVLEYRRVSKIVGTYIENYYAFMSSYVPSHQSRIHPSFSMVRARTGRLSSSSPNFQNQTADIRRSWTSRYEGGHLMEADLSQIELRILAHESGDPELTRVFCEGEDLHGEVADMIVAPRVKGWDAATMRTAAKRINFGIAYLAGPKTIAKQVPGLSEAVAETLINGWYDKFRGVAEWQDKIKDMCIHQKKVYNIFGRVRHLIGGRRKTKDGESVLRQAVNFPIQSGASDLMVYGIMPEINRELLGIGKDVHAVMNSRIVCNIHDSVVIDVYPGEEEVVAYIIDKAMTDPQLPPMRGDETGREDVARWSSISSIPITYEMKAMGADIVVDEEDDDDEDTL